MLRAFFAGLVCLSLSAQGADEVSLRLGGKEIQLPAPLRAKIVGFARETLARCGPNTRQHPDNFGASALTVDKRWKALSEGGSRLRIAFGEPFKSESLLGGSTGVQEAWIGLEQKDFFVGPDFTRYGSGVVEHLRCEYLPALELACLPELAPHLPASYRDTCAKMERDSAGRIVMPPPDIAPSCS
ncbi:MAG TPA: hypothetical protein VHN19_06645 [Burkholderiales bacterium]|nr:hypothetical protein [Burkholderiales bacterium]